MIVTLCGSARFEPWFHAWNEALSLSGHCVFGLAAYPSHHDGVKDWYTVEMKTILDRLHKTKIEYSDAILVLNVFAYMGESTLSEVAHARGLKRQTGRSGPPMVHFLESWGQGNGIDEGHFDYIQAAANKFGVWGKGSPIDTIHGHHAGVINGSPWDLLGEAGERRSSIVTTLKRRLEPIAHGWGA